ncbi:MAG: redox-sensing transcriptional repressor Rex [Candidatus Edwardsbacteria bacterium]|jgi:redox-sensing transcriptional repressor|nr:redox-sensing transcriptional repressor Rex [Candidatus Edwardsbacteria bacterium]
MSGKQRAKIPEPAIRRLSFYRRHLADLAALGVATISSREIAQVYGLEPFQVRKDLSYFGSFGRRGRGYPVRTLLRRLERILGLDRRWRIALVGAGNIGMALFRYAEYRRQGFEIAAVFDADPRKIGTRLEHGVTVQPMERIGAAVAELGIRIGIVAVPPGAAQQAAEALAAAGIKAILSFPGGQVLVPKDVALRRVNLEADLEALSYFLANK